MPVSLAALGSVFVVSLASLAGAFTLTIRKARMDQVMFSLVAFAVGAMFGAAFLHLIPEAYGRLGEGPRVGVLVLSGVVAFFVLESFLHWRHEHGHPEEQEPVHKPFATMNLIGNGVHNLIDGAVIAAAYLVSMEAGLVTTLAVLLHEVPQEIGNYGVLVYGGYEPKRALLFNFISGLIGLLGAVLVLVLGVRVEGLSDTLLPITAGLFLYIAGSDLIPELNRQDGRSAGRSLQQLALMIAGVVLMVLPFFFGHTH